MGVTSPNRLAALLLCLLAIGCGGGIPDADGDGIPDDADWCSTVVEEPNGFEDDNGCPDVIPETPPAPLSLHLLGSWYGEGTMRVAGRQDIQFGSRNSRIHGAAVVVAGVRTADAVIYPTCLDGDGIQPAVIAVGSGNTLRAERTDLTCPSFGPTTCPRTIRYVDLLLVASDDASGLQMAGVGTFSDCTITDAPMTVTFYAPTLLKVP